MPAFQPSRASPPPTRVAQPRATGKLPSSLDVTLSSTTSSASAALAGLSPEDVSLIDDIIDRAPSSATTFLTVFKAYNEVLQERGLDTANDVVYYKLLLKLGLMKGHDWGTKWRAAKLENGYGEWSRRGPMDSTRDYETEDEIFTSGPIPPRFREVPRRAAKAPLVQPYDQDSFTVHSHRDHEVDLDDDATRSVDDFSSPATLIHRGRGAVSDTNALRLRVEQPPYPPLPSIEQFLPVNSRRQQQEFDSSVDESPRSPEAGPSVPSVQADVSRHRAPIKTRQPLADAKKDGKATQDDEDTWAKIRMIRDEKEADRFREITLMERCWQFWVKSVQWTVVRAIHRQEARALISYPLCRPQDDRLSRLGTD